MGFYVRNLFKCQKNVKLKTHADTDSCISMYANKVPRETGFLSFNINAGENLFVVRFIIKQKYMVTIL